MERDLLVRELSSLNLDVKKQFDKEYLDSEISNPTPVVANAPVCSITPGLTNKIGFEFDLLLSLAKDFKVATAIPDGKVISAHSWATNGFELKIDGNKIEVSTKPFDLDATGRKEMVTAFNEIEIWINKIKKVLKDDGKDIVVSKQSNCASCLSGRGRILETKNISPATNSVLKINNEFINVDHFIFPLHFPQKTADYFTSDLNITAVPQATLGLPLAKIEELTLAIKDPNSKGISIRLTGSSTHRLGLRSDALFNAQHRVSAMRTFFFKTGTFNGLKITKANFSDTLTGFLILLTQYLWTGVLLEDLRDHESFSKAYVPLHSKIRFREMFHCLLSKDEQELFLKVFWEGNKWKNLFSLTKSTIKGGAGYNRTTKIEDTPDLRLFPSNITLPSGASLDRKRPTWHKFVNSIVENEVTFEDTTGPGKQTLVSHPTKALALNTNAVVVELRRMGFKVFPSNKFFSMADTLFNLALKLNK